MSLKNVSLVSLKASQKLTEVSRRFFLDGDADAPLRVLRVRLPVRPDNKSKREGPAAPAAVINVVQEGFLLAGTKQRVAVAALRRALGEARLAKIHTLVYCGAYYGVGLVAVAYAAAMLGKRAVLFVSREGLAQEEVDTKRPVVLMRALGAEVRAFSNYYVAKKEANDFSYAANWVTDPEAEQKPGVEFLPMGINDAGGVMVDELAKRMRAAVAAGPLYTEGGRSVRAPDSDPFAGGQKGRRIWAVTGSGGVAAALRKAFPDHTLMVLLTGGDKFRRRTLDWASAAENRGAVTVVDDLSFTAAAEVNVGNDVGAYYSSVDNYDGLLWPYLKLHGKDGDVVWNVCADALPEP